MMSSFSICQLDQITLTIFEKMASFQDAQQQCKNEEKILLNPLQRNQYSKLKNCRYFRTNEKYWTGFKYVSINTCSTQFQRVDNSECVRISPLDPETQPINGNECKAVVLNGEDNRNRNLPNSKIFDCADRNYFICQSKRQPTTTTTSTSKTTTTTTGDKQTKTTGKPSLTTEISGLSSFPQNTTTSNSHSGFKIEILFGALLFCLIIFSILMFFLYRRYGKKRCSKRSCYFQHKSKQLNTSVISKSDKQMSVDPSFCIVERSCEKPYYNETNSFADDSEPPEDTTYQQVFYDEFDDKNNHATALVHNSDLKPEKPNLKQNDESNNVSKNSSTVPSPQSDESDKVEEPDVYATVKKKTPVLPECEYAAINKAKK